MEPNDEQEGNTVEPFSSDAYFSAEAMREAAELREIVAGLHQSLTEIAGAELIVCGGHALHFLGVGQRLLEAVRMANTIGAYLTPFDGPPGTTEPSSTPEPVVNLIDLLADLPPPAGAVEEAAGRYIATLYRSPAVPPPSRRRLQ